MNAKLQNRNMIGLLFCGLVLAQSLPATGQTTGSAARLANYEVWQTSFQVAVDLGRRTNRPILLVFNQSDHPGDSKLLVNNILQTHEFAEWSTENAVKLEVDFPKGYVLSETARRQNEQLFRRYGKHVTTFPTIVLIAPSGEILGVWKYKSITVDRFIDTMDMMIPARKRSGDLST